MEIILAQLFSNRILLSGLTAWFLAQFLKPFIEYPIHGRLKPGLWFASGGMPSSHSSLVTATCLSAGLYEGFDSAAFAVAFAIAMIVIYDAAGVRLQAGLQAKKINELVDELLSGHPISQETLKEVIGHTPRQVLAGILLGIAVAGSVFSVFPPVVR